MRRVVLDDNHNLTRYTEEPCRQHWTGIDQDIVQHDEYEAMASANVTNLDTKGKICRSLCSAVKEIELEGLCSKARALGLRVDQAWAAPRGQGFKAVAARFMVDSEEVLVVAFRSTFGSDEWIEYPQRYWKRRFTVQDGQPAGSKLRVFSIWNDTLDEVWNMPGEKVQGCADSLRSMIWRQLNAGNRVWLTGHSKGGAVATTAAARLLLGDSVVDRDLADPATRRPEGAAAYETGCALSRLSIYTFNAPMALSEELAQAYEARVADITVANSTELVDGTSLMSRGIEHIRFEHKSDEVRRLPAGVGLVHVGSTRYQGESIFEDKGVIAGGVIAVAGVAAALIAACSKVVDSH